jgi:hypothetical protein
MFSCCVGQLLNWDMNEWTIGSGNSISLHSGPTGGPWRGGSLTGDFERKVRLFY